MGNNSAFTAFEATVMTLYDAKALTLVILDSIAEQYRGTDIDSGGCMGLVSNDGKDIYQVCMELAMPNWAEEYPPDPDDEYDESFQIAWGEMKYDRWGWRQPYRKVNMPRIHITLTDDQKEYLEKAGIKNISAYIRKLIRSDQPNLPPDSKWGGNRKGKEEDDQ